MERKHKFLIQRLAEFVFESDKDYEGKVGAIAEFLAKRYPRSTKKVLDYLRKLTKERILGAEEPANKLFYFSITTIAAEKFSWSVIDR